MKADDDANQRPIPEHDRTSGTGQAGSVHGEERGDGERGGDATSSILDIHVSPQAQALSNRAAAFEQLKARVQNGTFKVDPDAIANKLVGE